MIVAANTTQRWQAGLHERTNKHGPDTLSRWDKQGSVPRGDHFEIEELMQIVEGPIQMIPLHDGRIMTLNEEGKPDAQSGRAGLPLNEQATALAGFASTGGPLSPLRGLGVEPLSYAVGPGDLPYIPGTVLVSTRQEVSWTE